MGVQYIASIDNAYELREFVWGGAKDRVRDLTDEQCERLIDLMDEIFEGEAVEDTRINDFIWFDEDTWMEAIGLSDEEEDEEDEEDED